MTWREQFRQASFRGVVFHVENAEASGGRRVALYEFPGRERPYTEDLRRRARSFSIDALVIGDGYMAARRRGQARVNQHELPHGFARLLGRRVSAACGWASRLTIVACFPRL